MSEISVRLLGLPTIGSPFTVLAFCFMAFLLVLGFKLSLSDSVNRERIDRGLFWVFGIALVAFTALRPVGLARDDYAYFEILKTLCPLHDCTKSLEITRDYVWYGAVKLIAVLLPGGMLAALVLSAFGVLLKLAVIDRMCSDRLLALLLLVPLSFVQYDLSQLRAGLASSWMLLGIFWLARSHVRLGGALLFANFAVHSQAIFSPGLLAYRVFGLSRWVLPIGILLMLGMIYVGVYPSLTALNWLGGLDRIKPYFLDVLAGNYVGVKIFPLAYLLILAYAVLLCATVPNKHQRIGYIVSAGVFLGTLLAWLFAAIPTMQTRLFEFYTVPLVFLAGNVGRSRLKISLTCILALVLYLRLELLHEWILG